MAQTHHTLEFVVDIVFSDLASTFNNNKSIASCTVYIGYIQCTWTSILYNIHYNNATVALIYKNYYTADKS